VVTSAVAAPRVAAVRAWWRVQHPPPPLSKRLDVAYTAALVTGIFGAMAYGTASSALTQVVTPRALAVFGPSVALVALVVAAQGGAYQGPVVFSVADVAHLLGAPLPRRALGLRRMLLALGAGAVAGALIGAAVVVGLAGGERTIAAGRGAALVAGCAELGVLAVCAAWAVQRSARIESAARRAIWPALAAGAALADLPRDVVNV